MAVRLAGDRGGPAAAAPSRARTPPAPRRRCVRTRRAGRHGPRRSRGVRAGRSGARRRSSVRGRRAAGRRRVAAQGRSRVRRMTAWPGQAARWRPRSGRSTPARGGTRPGRRRPRSTRTAARPTSGERWLVNVSGHSTTVGAPVPPEARRRPRRRRARGRRGLSPSPVRGFRVPPPGEQSPAPARGSPLRCDPGEPLRHRPSAGRPRQRFTTPGEPRAAQPQPRRQPAHRVVRGAAAAAPVVVVQELRLVRGHVHVDRAVGAAALAGQAQVERVAHLRASASRRRSPRRRASRAAAGPGRGWSAAPRRSTRNEGHITRAARRHRRRTALARRRRSAEPPPRNRRRHPGSRIPRRPGARWRRQHGEPQVLSSGRDGPAFPGSSRRPGPRDP